MYNKIIQLSDIHIHKSIDRHNEYKQVFSNLYEQLDELCNRETTLIVICGDLVHNKNDLHPNQITLLISLFKKLIYYGDLIIINGNHDINLSNSISSISIFSEFNNKIHFIDETGIYNFDNVDITVIDIKDLNSNVSEEIFLNENGLLNDIESNSDIINVLCIHKYIRDGMTNSYYNKNEYPIPKNICSKDILPNYFDKFDIVCLGDIHSPQFLRKNIAYSGSLIQQNYGEHPYYHGFIEWNLENDNTGKFHIVYNDTGYFKCNAKEMIENYEKSNNYQIICDKYFYNRKNLNIELCCEYDFMYSKEFLEFKNNFKEYLIRKNYKIYSYIHTLIQNDKFDLRNNTENIDHINMYYNETKLLDIQNEWIKTYYKSIHQEYNIDKMIEYNKFFYENTHKDGTNKLQTNSSHFHFEKLRFKNVFCFETNRERKDEFFEINFKNGIIAIDGDNYSGKSSILDILCFVLFEETTRGKAKKQDIMNKNSKSFTIECILCKNNERYMCSIQCNRKEMKSKKLNKITLTYPSSRKLYKMNEFNEYIEINFEKNGYSFFNDMTFDDFIKSYVLIQNNLFGWLDDGPTERDKFLKKLCKWDDIDVQYKECLKYLLEKEKELKTIEKQKNDYQQIVQKYKSNLINEDYELQLQQYEQEKLEYMLLCKQFEQYENNYDIEIIKKKYDETKTYLIKKKMEYEKIIKECNDCPEYILNEFTTEEMIEQQNNDFLKIKSQELEFLYNKCNNLKSNIKHIALYDEKYTECLNNEELQNYNQLEYEQIKKKYEDICNSRKRIQSCLDTELYKKYVIDYRNTKSLTQYYFDTMKQWNDCKKEFNKKCKYCCNLVNYNQYIEYEKEYEKNKKCLEQIKINILSTLKDIPTFIDMNQLAQSDDMLMYINEQVDKIYQEYTILTNQYTNYKILYEKKKQYDNHIENQKLYEENIEKYKNWNKTINECIYNVENEIQNRLNEKNIVYELNKKRYDTQKLIYKYTKDIENYENILNYEKNKTKLDELNIEYEKIKYLCRKKYENENLFNVYNQSYNEYCNKYEECKSIINEYEIYKELFGVNGIPKWLYQKTIPKIEKLLNSWCQELKLDFSYQFSYSQNETMNYYLLDLGIIHNNSSIQQSHEIQLGSGLEKTITNILLRNAFDGLQNNRVDFFWIDETLSNMDQNHINKLEKLFELLKKTFKCVFIISHQKEMYEYVDYMISIKKSQSNRYITHS